ncbi:MAG: CarD family transcriptional regulator [Alphaproteobacteria bacterium]|nr:CarD family transcriptional regulator [Alphaproteobacteria bacterium]
MPNTKKKPVAKPAKRPNKPLGQSKAKPRVKERNKPAARRGASVRADRRPKASPARKTVTPKKAAGAVKTPAAKVRKPSKAREAVAPRQASPKPVAAKIAKLVVRPSPKPEAQKPKLKVIARATPPAPAPIVAPPKIKEESAVETSRKLGFQVGDHVVYPSHGVGKIVGIESHTVGEQALQMFVVLFEKERMTLRVPMAKVTSAGMRKLSSPEKMDAAVSALKGRVRARRVMWSRRAQEYEAKLNSGDPVAIAEVIRDLHRNVGQPDQSYSERQMYEAALERLAREFAAVQKIDTVHAAERLEKVLRAA